MKSTFPTVALGELCDVQIGKTPTRATERYWAPDHPWLSIADMNQGRQLKSTKERVSDTAVRELNLRRVERGTVLLSFKLSIGKVGVAARPMFTNEAIAHLPIIGDAVLPEYLYWALRTVPLTGDADRAAMGATLNKAKLKRIAIPVPPIAEQRRIAAVLDAADALRDQRRQALAKLVTLAPAIFIDMFGDPVANNRSWEVVSLSSVLDAIDGGKSPVCLARPAEPGEWGVLKAGAVTYCEFDATQTKALPKDVKPDERSEVRAGDVLFARKNTHDLVAACAYVYETPGRLLMSDLIFRLVIADPSVLDPMFLRSQLVHARMRKMVQRMAGGSSGSMPNISKSKLMGVDICLPPAEMQRDFARRVLRSRAAADHMRKDAARLGALFSALQQRAFRGEL